jgi:AcrR family transcriptional regulator
MTAAPPRSGAAQAIIDAARGLLVRDPSAPMSAITEAAGVSRATFYRHFRSRGELLAALEIEPDPDSRERILTAAVELIGRDGLRGMSIDELAAAAGVSRASVYRLFPGKAALFDALLAEHSPFDALLEVFREHADRPPSELLPLLARSLATAGAPRIGLLRSLFFEVSSLSPDALTGADPRIRQVVGAMSGYLGTQMQAGRLRRMHPLLAAQLLLGPIVFHLVSRAEIDRLGLLDLSIEQAVDEFSAAALRALAP